MDLEYLQFVTDMDKQIYDNLREYAAGDGSRAFSVIIQNKEFVANTKELAESVKRAKNSIDDNIKIGTENNKLLKENNEIEKQKKENLRKEQEQHNARMIVAQKIIGGLSAFAGFITGRIDAENKLYKSLAESNIIYSDNVKEINKYANALGMSLEEYTTYLQQNSQQYNIIQSRLSNIIDSTSLEWKKISKETGATREEMTKGLSTYSKYVISTGEITQLSAKQYNEGATKFITDVKLLSKALGVNTDTILKQIESHESHWQMQALLANESTRKGAMAMQAAGFSPDLIVAGLTGRMNETAAKQMALNEYTNAQIQLIRNASSLGKFSTIEDIASVAKQFNSPEMRALQEQDYARKQNNNITMLATASQEYFTGLDYGASKRGETFAQFANIGKGDEGFNKILESITRKETSQNVMENNAFAMMQLGEEIIGVNDTASAINEKVSDMYDLIKQNYGEIISILNGYVGKTGTIIDKALPLLERAYYITQLIYIFKSLKGLTKIGNLFKSGGTFSKVAGSLNKVGNSLSKASNLVAGQTATKIISKGSAVLGAGVSAYNAYDNFKNNNKLDGTKEAIKTGLWGISAVPGLGWAGIAGEAIDSGASWATDKIYDLINGDPKEKQKERLQKMNEAFAKQQEMRAKINYNTPQTSKLKNNTSSPSDNIQNQKSQKVEIVNPTSTNNSSTDNTASIEELVNVNGKLTQLVDLFTDVKSNISQLASKMPMNNYG